MNNEKLKLAVLISGRGSNLQSIIDACKQDDFPAEISVVISNRPDAYGIKRAEKAGIKIKIIDHKNYEDRASFEEDLHNELIKYQPDIIVLAGFMRILTADFVRKWQDHIINIHPSLLPDYKGLNTHARALADNKKEAGCTVHYVVPEMDSGPIIVQKKVPIIKGDTPETLAERVLKQEHIAYPEAIRIVAKDISTNKNK